MSRQLQGVLAASLLGVSLNASATLLAYWNFNDGDLLVDQGSGTMSVTTGSGLAPVFAAGSALNAQGGDPAGLGFGLEANTQGGLYDIRFALDLTGFSDLRLTFDWRGDPSWRTGLNGTQTTFFSSADGGASFVPLFQTPPPAVFLTNTGTETFHLVSALDNNPNVVIQIRQIPNALTTGEQMNFDNFVFTAEAITPVSMGVPEPATLLLTLLGGVGLAAGHARRRSAR